MFKLNSKTFSFRIKHINFFDSDELLLVEFRNGTLYEFYGVPREVAAKFQKALIPYRHFKKILIPSPYPYNKSRIKDL